MSILLKSFQQKVAEVGSLFVPKSVWLMWICAGKVWKGNIISNNIIGSDGGTKPFVANSGFE